MVPKWKIAAGAAVIGAGALLATGGVALANASAPATPAPAEPPATDSRPAPEQPEKNWEDCPDKAGKTDASAV